MSIDESQEVYVSKREARSLQTDQTAFIDLQSKTAEWLAEKIFDAFPGTTGLMFYILECGCIYHCKQAPEGDLDRLIGIYRDPAKGDCEPCLGTPIGWEARVLEEMAIYKIELEVAFCQ